MQRSIFARITTCSKFDDEYAPQICWHYYVDRYFQSGFALLFRHILGYAPSNFVPAIVSFAGIYVFTRLLPPEQYGVYALVFNIAFMLQAVLSFWLRNGSTRFYDRSAKDGTLPSLISTTYVGYAISAVIFGLIYAIVLLAIPVSSHLQTALWIGLPFIILKGLITVTNGIHRGGNRIRRYNLLECGQSVLGLLCGMALVYFFGMREQGILFGLVCGSLIAVLFDAPFIIEKLKTRINRNQLKTMFLFGAPLTAGVILNMVMSTSDRILVEYFLGSGAVGIYAVSYGIMNQPMTLVFFAVAMPGLPLAIRALELHGKKAAQEQMNRNGMALLALAIPACAGLIAVREHLAYVLIGEAYRVAALQIMPWIAVSAALAGLQVHYFDHAFTLGKRPTLLIKSIGIAALVDIGLNILLLPRIGIMGAAYATLISYVVAIAGSIYFGWNVFRVPFPHNHAFKTLISIVPMCILLTVVRFPLTMLGLLTMVISGALCYGVTALALNVCDAREKLWQRFA